MNSIKLRLRKAHKLLSYFTWHIYVTVILQYHIKFFEHAPREFKRLETQRCVLPCDLNDCVIVSEKELQKSNYRIFGFIVIQ